MPDHSPRPVKREKWRVELERLAAKDTARYRPWTAEEEALIKKFYPKLGARALAKTLGRTMRAVWHKASILDVQYRGQ